MLFLFWGLFGVEESLDKSWLDSEFLVVCLSVFAEIAECSEQWSRPFFCMVSFLDLDCCCIYWINSLQTFEMIIL